MINVLVIFVMYWVDKYLLLRFYRTPRNISDEVILFTVQKFKWAFVIHAIFGVFALSNPNILSSGVAAPSSQMEKANMLLETWSGGYIFIPERFAQTHVLIFIFQMFVYLVMIAFEDLMKNLVDLLPRKMFI